MAEPGAPPLILNITPRWTEAALEALGQDEYDYQEFKGSLWMSKDRQVVSVFLHMLSKQVSAFANGAGGRLVIGLDDAGAIDGGVPVDLKGGGTRSWLEDVIPGLVSPTLRSFNVFEVLGRDPGTAIQPGRAVYVIEIPASEDAPHQAHDRRYYLRIAGKSRPMGHIHIEDVLRRTRSPKVRLERLAPFGKAAIVQDDPRGDKAVLSFRAFLLNEGRSLAQHVGLELILPRPLVNNEVRSRMVDEGHLTLTQEPGHLTFFRYHPTPVFPGQRVQALQIWIVLHRGNLAFARGTDAVIRSRVYADDAPAQQDTWPITRYKAVKRALSWVERQTPSRKKGRDKKGEPSSS
ncbi:MAG: ATP-binding protein [Oligoflexia bacterium]|nr:ATP-binding protein [Oligoflexia bacterium]